MNPRINCNQMTVPEYSNFFPVEIKRIWEKFEVKLWFPGIWAFSSNACRSQPLHMITFGSIPAYCRTQWDVVSHKSFSSRVGFRSIFRPHKLGGPSFRLNPIGNTTYITADTLGATLRVGWPPKKLNLISQLLHWMSMLLWYRTTAALNCVSRGKLQTVYCKC